MNYSRLFLPKVDQRGKGFPILKILFYYNHSGKL